MYQTCSFWSENIATHSDPCQAQPAKRNIAGTIKESFRIVTMLTPMTLPESVGGRWWKGSLRTQAG